MRVRVRVFYCKILNQPLYIQSICIYELIVISIIYNEKTIDIVLRKYDKQKIRFCYFSIRLATRYLCKNKIYFNLHYSYLYIIIYQLFRITRIIILR